MSKVKICGLSRIEDVECVNRTLPDYAGFVFADSPRKVDEKKARMLKEKLDMNVEAVGVFVNEEIETVERLYFDNIIDLVQLHGDEDEAFIRQVKKDCGCQVIKAVAVGDAIPQVPKGPDYLIFDPLSTLRGGTGRTFDWNILKGFTEKPYFLAGGLNAANVQEAIRALSPYCVDVSGGVETNGVKDAAKIEEFVRIVREAR